MKIKQALAAVLFALLVFVTVYVWLHTKGEVDVPAPIHETQEHPVQKPATAETKETDIILKTISSFWGNEAEYSIFSSCVRGTECNIFLHDDVPMRSASMIKVFILGYAMDKAKDNALDLQESMTIQDIDKVGGSGILADYPNGTELSILELLRLMIAESDNTATNIMIDRLGMEQINRYIVEQGYTNTILQRKMMDFNAAADGHENFTSARDLGEFFFRLYHHQCVSPKFDDTMIELLKEQTDNEALPAALPNFIIAHKTGELLGAYHDGGIVFGETDWILVIMTDGYNNRNGAIDAIRKTAHFLINGS